MAQKSASTGDSQNLSGHLTPLQPATTPLIMLNLAIERGATIEILERLLTLQERWEQNEARKAFVKAMAAFKKNPPTVIKDRRAGFDSKRTGDRTEYDYATLDQVASVIGAALGDHGLSHRWETAQTEGKIRVTCFITHEMGHSENTTLEAAPDTSGNKNSVQAIGSTITYLERYTLLAAVGLAAKGQDDDAFSGDNDAITDDERAELNSLIEAASIDPMRFCLFMGVTSIDDLPRHRFEEAKFAIAAKQEENRRKAK